MLMTASYHIPALLDDSIAGLAIKSDGTYVDVTFGGGGHSRSILDRLGPDGHLFAFDQDEAVKGHLPEDARFTFIHHNFKYLGNYLRDAGVDVVDGILADLGVSFHQFDTADRGFSTRFDGPLDMRMDRDADLTARTVVEEYSEEELYRVFRDGADLKGVGRIVRTLIQGRSKGYETTIALKEALSEVAPRQGQSKFFAQVFQALRIEVNHELDVLKSFLKQAIGLLKPGGRLVVISYHSLEDRMVKHFMRAGNAGGEIETDIYGRSQAPLKPVQRKVIMPSEEEVERNPRARSAKLRIAEKQ